MRIVIVPFIACHLLVRPSSLLRRLVTVAFVQAGCGLTLAAWVRNPPIYCGLLILGGLFCYSFIWIVYFQSKTRILLPRIT